LGLIGSDFYVNSLSPEELEKISLYLNLDMVGSPNFVRWVYDGDGSSGGFMFPPGSDAIEYLFRDYFVAVDLPVEELALTASDNFSFAAAGVPVGGLFTGAGGFKTPGEAALYGGTAGVAYDPCYHQACDGFDNASLTALDEMSDAAAHALLTLAEDRFSCLLHLANSPNEVPPLSALTEFMICLAGPTLEVQACCLCSDLTEDNAVALDDFAVFQNRFGDSL
jgi:Zn-dependent M28 family amino/carboxypeptidase